MAPPMPRYLLDDVDPSVFCWRDTGWNWWCMNCRKYATQEHVESDGHQKRSLWWSSANAHAPSPIPTSTNAHCKPCPQGALTTSPWTQHYSDSHQQLFYHNSEHGLSTWHPPPSWWNEWLVQVHQSGMFTSKTIVDICGGPDLQGAEPPHVGFLASARCKPRCDDVKMFFGPQVFENLQQRAQHHGETHPKVAPFGRQGSTWAVVYTDGTPSRTKSPLSPDDECGMWFPTLAVQTCDGSGCGWGLWCLDAAANDWDHDWVVHPSRLHLYVQQPQACPYPTSHSPSMSSSSNHNTQNSGTAGSSTDPVSQGPTGWTVVADSTVVIEEIETQLHGQR